MATKAHDPKTPGAELVVVLAGPKTPGNVGSVARVMSNFDVSELRLYDSVNLDDGAYQRAVHAGDILDSARHYRTFSRSLRGLDFTVGTTGITNLREKRHVRNPLTPKQLVERISGLRGRVGLVFGREDYGMFNEELALCDVVVTIPTSKRYPVMNLSHAVAVLLYELNRERAIDKEATVASEHERDLLLGVFRDLLDTTGYPQHKRLSTEVMIRRILGRATLSKWEFHTMMGVVKRPVKQLHRMEANMRAAGMDPDPRLRPRKGRGGKGPVKKVPKRAKRRGPKRTVRPSP
jgi:TrmH family RNA methyltransferase